MSQHPQVEAKIVKELRQHNLLVTAEQPNPRAIQWDDIPTLTYLNAVIKVSFPGCWNALGLTVMHGLAGTSVRCKHTNSLHLRGCASAFDAGQHEGMGMHDHSMKSWL